MSVALENIERNFYEERHTVEALTKRQFGTACFVLYKEPKEVDFFVSENH